MLSVEARSVKAIQTLVMLGADPLKIDQVGFVGTACTVTASTCM